MNRSTLGILAVLAVGVAIPQSGCVAGVGLTAHAYPSTLVEISPGVWVVSDYSEPVFYHSGSYWWWNGSAWYSSRYVDDRYRPARATTVPVYIRQIQQPRTYVNYPPRGTARPVPPGHVRREYPNRGGGPRPPGGPGGGPRGPGR